MQSFTSGQRTVTAEKLRSEPMNSPRPLKICFVSHSGALHGAELVLLEIIDASHHKGVECVIILPGEGALSSELSKRAIPFQVLPYDWWASPGRSLRSRMRAMARNTVTAFQLARLVRKWQCDAIYTNTIVVPIGAFAAILARRPHIWHIHEFGALAHGLKFDWGEKLALALIDKLSAVCLTNSTTVTNHFAKFIDPRKLRLVYCSMQLASLRAQPDERAQQQTHARVQAFRCVLVGRLVEGKGQEDAVLAIAELAKASVKAELILVGDGTPAYIERLKGHIVLHNLGDRVSLTGPLDNPASVVSSANAVLMCSRYEAFGRVTIEGMLAGKAVIGARSGATPELIQEGFTGLLYSPGNVHELANHIRYLAENRAEALRMGRNARAWAIATFSEERLAQSLLEIFVSVIPAYAVRGMTA